MLLCSCVVAPHIRMFKNICGLWAYCRMKARFALLAMEEYKPPTIMQFHG